MDGSFEQEAGRPVHPAPSPEIVAIGQTSVDWSTFLQASKRALGRDASASLDQHGFPAQGVAAFIGAIAEFARQGSDPIQSLREGGLLLRHAHFTFLVFLPRTEFFTLSTLGLSVTPSDGDFAIVSGLLSSWRHAVVDALKLNSSDSIRMLFCKILVWFERNDLGEVWGTFEKQSLLDKTFILRSKDAG